MRRWRWGLGCLLFVACSRGEPIPDQDLSLRISTSVERAQLGAAFPLTVERVWSKDCAPEPWRDEALAPLIVSDVEVSERQDARHFAQTRRYRAYAFVAGDFTVPAIAWQAQLRDGGPVAVTASAPLHLQVESALRADSPLEPELPSGLLLEPSSSWSSWWIATAVLVVLLGLAWFRANKRPRAVELAPPTAPAVPGPAPHVLALARLERLRAQVPQGREQVQAYYVEATALVREYVEARFTVRTAERTTPELVRALEALREVTAGDREALRGFLTRCDLVKFANHVPGDPERERLLAAAAQFLVETAGHSHNGVA